MICWCLNFIFPSVYPLKCVTVKTKNQITDTPRITLHGRVCSICGKDWKARISHYLYDCTSDLKDGLSFWNAAASHTEFRHGSSSHHCLSIISQPVLEVFQSHIMTSWSKSLTFYKQLRHLNMFTCLIYHAVLYVTETMLLLCLKLCRCVFSWVFLFCMGWSWSGSHACKPRP